MVAFLARRLLTLFASLLAASFAIYLAVYLAPGSPLAALSGGRSLTPAAARALERRYDLDEPFFARYWHWLRGVLHGDLGTSISLHEGVGSLIGERTVTTLLLVALASLIILVVGLGLGLLGALRPGLVDESTVAVSSFLAGVPSFIAALILVSIFSVNLGWLPALGNGSGFTDEIKHLVLPAIALAASSLGLVARISRAAVRDQSARDHVTTARSRGIPRAAILRRHVLRNAAIPITAVVGLTVASLIAIAAVVETAFSLTGLGSTLVEAASSKDLPLVQGISLVLVAAFVVSGAITDVCQAMLDPRTRMKRGLN